MGISLNNIKTMNDSFQVYLDSLTIRERVKLLPRIKYVNKDNETDAKIMRWKLQVGESSESFFRKRLEWSNLNQTNINKLLCPIRDFDTEGFKFPSWVSSMEDFQKSKKIFDIVSKSNNKVPFSEIIIPLVNYFYSSVKNIPAEFSENAVIDLKVELLHHLSRISSQSLLEALHNSKRTYQDFINFILNDSYKSFFIEHPYLARLIFTRGEFWVNNTLFLFKSFEKDKKLLDKRLGTKFCTVLGIKSDLSESHNYGKNVMILETDIKKFVFKYRGVAIERSFFKFLDYLNKNLSIKQYIPWIIDGGRYGWMEFIEQNDCKDTNSVKNFYERIGSQLCIHYIFGTTDLHSENLIAHGQFPIFVDLETLLSPLLKLNNSHLNSLNEYIDSTFGLSVSRSGILPQWLLGPDTSVYNNSALGGSKSGLHYPSIVWSNISTDQISYDYIDAEPTVDKNLVYKNSRIQDPDRYISSIICGFTKTYNYFFKNKESRHLRKELRNFENINIRFVFRATKIYTLLLEYLNHPDYMKSGVTRSIEMDLLAKGFLVDLSKKHIFWDILNDELTQLENNDVPYYTTNTSIPSLVSTNAALYEDAFQFKPYKRLLSIVSSLSVSDLSLQVQIIKNSIETKSLGGEHKSFSKYTGEKVVQPDNNFISTVIFDIANRILKSQITVNGRSTWVSFVSNIVSHTYGYKPLGLDIANGNMGVALFIGALYAYSKDKIYKEALESILKPISDILTQDWSKQEFMHRFGTGGTTGVASIIYGFTKLYEYTADPSFIDSAYSFVDIIKKENIQESVRQDVTSGNAGLLLSIIKLSQVKKEKEFSELMDHCYKTIVSSGYNDNRFKNWDYQQNKKLLGFSHGSSGILYALSNYLTYKKQSKETESVIKDVLVYEDTLFDKAHLNWPDYRFEDVDLEVSSWCHGATGIGMSRLPLLNLNIFNDLAEKDVHRAINKTVQTGAHFLDTCCCGNSGRVDFLLELQNTKFYNRNLDNYLFWLVNILLHRYKTTGDFRYFSKFHTEDINVGFYQGISGVGYELLRFVSPKEFGSVLLFK